ncbi:glycosyltransferase family protein [Arthrobacter antibioticus]|uniref:glycosyltransferase family protein n=1 Tax=Arthrobacter sp. H35-MC1 TaxID=3046203 RepID=UPI0024B982FB|nr:glycosyltransferase [Arthrobacter sp. H35-MC1]MDJ0316240.1 glycosyltransferase [Arthrobacter sp. H35-MC1]
MYSLAEIRIALWHLTNGGVNQVQEWQARRRSELGFASPRDAKGVEGGWIGSGRRRRLTFADAVLPQDSVRRKDLKVGVILDSFSALAFGFEWESVSLDPRHGSHQLDGMDLVFVESAWAGNDKLWTGKLTSKSGPSQELRGLLNACKEKSIPTVFWNKEDPPHYDDFLPAAKLFDFVFTSDESRIECYIEDLGHDRVDVLSFAAQPAVHNPVRPSKGWHVRDVAFAGMYFSHKFPERREQMDFLLGGAMDVSTKMKTGLEIFSRFLGGGPQYQFPVPLDSRVVGSLTYQQMLSAYKAYKVFLNVNSVVESRSMCARRIFEISAAGTPVISAPSEAIRNFFSDLEVPIAVTREEAGHLTRALVSNSELNDRTVHLAQRRIWRFHTYSQRVEMVLERVLPKRTKSIAFPSVSALVCTIRPAQLEQIFKTVGSQEGVRPQLVVLTHGFEIPMEDIRHLQMTYDLPDVVALTARIDVSLGECLNRCVAASSGEILTKMDDDDYYGPNYLADQLYALSYSRADIVGKQAHYMHLESSNATILRFGHKEHKFTSFVMGPTIMGNRSVFMRVPFPDVRSGEDTGFLRKAREAGMKIYSADRFNFCQARNSSGHTWKLREVEALATSELKFYGQATEHITI